MIHTYREGQDVIKYDSAYKIAYDMGKSGVSLSYVMNSEATTYLSENQRQLAYEAGKAAADTKAKVQDAKNKQAATGKTGRRKGTVHGRGVKIEDLRKTFNDSQNTAYKILVTIAEATGIDIVLYKSNINANGDFEGAQGKFKWSEDTIYIDINSGLENVKSANDLSKYAMLRTFSHEFTHFIEKWNPVWYNEFRKAVFEELTARGENVDYLITLKAASGLDYDKASREFVAEAMTDILPDSHFVETLANKHKNIFQKLLEKLKEFLADIKAYFKALVNNPSIEASALKEQVGDAVHYVEKIVELFDKVAVESVENYQMTVAFEKKAENIATKPENKAKAEKTLFEKYNEVKQKYPNNIVLYRVGDFFEVLGEDAAFVAKWTGTTMTSRNDPNSGRVPMVGFPFHKLDKYVEKIRTHQDVTLVQEENGTAKEYPMASVKTSNNNATGGGIINGREQKETDNGRNSRTVETNNSGTRETNENRSEIQSTVGETQEGTGEESRLHRGQHNDRGLIEKAIQNIINPQNYITPDKNSDLYNLQAKCSNDYGIECHVVRKEAWLTDFFGDSPACSYKGKIYVPENIDTEDVIDVLPHETTHIMLQLKFKPYMDFLDSTPDMLNFKEEKIESLKSIIEEHLGINFFDMNDFQRNRFYDEINAFVYGLFEGGALSNTEYDYGEWIPSVFNDFESYTRELSAIHEQFKVERNGVGEYSDESIEKRENAYKKKFSQWLKKSSRKYALNYGGEKLLSNGAFGMKATEEEIGWAKLEFSGMITETDLPKQTATLLDNANTPVTEAPLEGGAGKDSVYVFNFDGRKNVYNKKLLSMLDGNLFYAGDFNGFKILKALDTKGTIAGFLLPLILNTEVTNTKPSKLKSFSNKFLSQISKQTELDEKRKRYNEVMEILNPKEEQALDSADEDTVQEQSRDYLGDYTEEEYNRFGWARENEVLSAKENERLRSLFADAVSKQANPPKTKSGEYMIAIGENVDNKIAYMTGDIDSPVITRVLEIDEYNETKLDEIRRDLYETERSGIQRQTGGVFTRYTRFDFGDNVLTEGSVRKRKGYNDQLRTERGRSSKTTSRVKEILFDDNGNEISRSYSDEQYQQRSEGLTDREVLELAANEVKVSDLTQAENDALTIFQDRLANLKDLQEKRAEQGRLYKEQQFGAKPNREEATKTHNRMQILDEQIKKATADVLSVEEKEVFKQVLTKARKVVELKERQHGQEILNRWRDRRNNAVAIKKYRDRLRGDVDELTNWIIGPNNKDIAKHVPDVLKNSVIPFLSSINFMSKRSLKGGNATVSDKEFIKRLNALQSAIKTNIDVYGMYICCTDGGVKNGYATDLYKTAVNRFEELKTKIQDSCLSRMNEFCAHYIAEVCLKLFTVVLNGFDGHRDGYNNITVHTVNYVNNQCSLMQQAIQYINSTTTKD